MYGTMTAIDVINNIKTLDPKERAEVIRFIHVLEARPPVSKSPPVSDREFEAAADAIMERHAPLLQKLAS